MRLKEYTPFHICFHTSVDRLQPIDLIDVLFLEAAHNPLVPGSSPGGPTTLKGYLQVAFFMPFSCRYTHLKAVFLSETANFLLS